MVSRLTGRVLLTLGFTEDRWQSLIFRGQGWKEEAPQRWQLLNAAKLPLFNLIWHFDLRVLWNAAFALWQRCEIVIMSRFVVAFMFQRRCLCKDSHSKREFSDRFQLSGVLHAQQKLCQWTRYTVSSWPLNIGSYEMCLTRSESVLMHKCFFDI